jgi:hypothetical protein
MPRSLLLMTLLSLTLALAAVLPVRAQGLLPTSEPADQQIGAALATPYAGALLQNFVKSVRENADSACLKDKGFDDAALIARGSALLQRYGEHMVKLMEENVDRTAYEKAFKERAGPRAVSEFEQLKRDGDVKKLIAIYQPAGQGKLIDSITENFDHYVTIGRIKFDSISPAARGEDAPNQKQVEAAEAAALKFIDAHPRKLNRYLDMLEAAIAARRKAITPQAAMKLGPMAYFAGADRDLAELCVGRK